MSGNDGADFRARILEMRPKSMRVRLIQERRAHWVPMACIHDDSDLYDKSEVGDEGKLVVFQWFAEKEGML